VTLGNAKQVLAEAERALEQCPDGATFAWAYKAEALRLLGRYEESVAAAQKIPALRVID
jgi:tetratricopeptide (TPR) repeat protein